MWLLIIETALILFDGVKVANAATEIMLQYVSLRKQRIKAAVNSNASGPNGFSVFSFPSHLYKERRDKQAAQE